MSVVLGAHEAASQVAPTLDSILAQSFRDFEVVVVEDGSRDRTREELRRFTGCDRVRVLENPENRGLTRSLIRAIGESHGAYVARIDMGDSMDRHRLERQVDYLDAHPAVVAVGSYCRVHLEEDGESIDDWLQTMPVEDAEIRRQLAFRTSLIHASSMYRRSAYEEVGGYDPDLSTTQDYDLWIRMSRVGGFHNIPEPLTTLVYDTTRSITHQRNRTQIRNCIRVMLKGMRSGDLPVLPTAFFLSKYAAMLVLPKRVNDLLRGARRRLVKGG